MYGARALERDAVNRLLGEQPRADRRTSTGENVPLRRAESLRYASATSPRELPPSRSRSGNLDAGLRALEPQERRRRAKSLAREHASMQLEAGGESAELARNEYRLSPRTGVAMQSAGWGAPSPEHARVHADGGDGGGGVRASTADDELGATGGPSAGAHAGHRNALRGHQLVSSPHAHAPLPSIPTSAEPAAHGGVAPPAPSLRGPRVIAAPYAPAYAGAGAGAGAGMAPAHGAAGAHGLQHGTPAAPELAVASDSNLLPTLIVFNEREGSLKAYRPVCECLQASQRLVVGSRMLPSVLAGHGGAGPAPSAGGARSVGTASWGGRADAAGGLGACACCGGAKAQPHAHAAPQPARVSTAMASSSHGGGGGGAEVGGAQRRVALGLATQLWLLKHHTETGRKGVPRNALKLYCECTLAARGPPAGPLGARVARSRWRHGAIATLCSVVRALCAARRLHRRLRALLSASSCPTPACRHTLAPMFVEHFLQLVGTAVARAGAELIEHARASFLPAGSSSGLLTGVAQLCARTRKAVLRPQQHRTGGGGGRVGAGSAEGGAASDSSELCLPLHAANATCLGVVRIVSIEQKKAGFNLHEVYSGALLAAIASAALHGLHDTPHARTAMNRRFAGPSAAGPLNAPSVSAFAPPPPPSEGAAPEARAFAIPPRLTGEQDGTHVSNMGTAGSAPLLGDGAELGGAFGRPLASGQPAQPRTVGALGLSGTTAGELVSALRRSSTLDPATMTAGAGAGCRGAAGAERGGSGGLWPGGTAPSVGADDAEGGAHAPPPAASAEPAAPPPAASRAAGGAMGSKTARQHSGGGGGGHSGGGGGGAEGGAALRGIGGSGTEVGARGLLSARQRWTHARDEVHDTVLYTTGTASAVDVVGVLGEVGSAAPAPAPSAGGSADGGAGGGAGATSAGATTAQPAAAPARSKRSGLGSSAAPLAPRPGPEAAAELSLGGLLSEHTAALSLLARLALSVPTRGVEPAVPDGSARALKGRVGADQAMQRVADNVASECRQLLRAESGTWHWFDPRAKERGEADGAAFALRPPAPSSSAAARVAVSRRTVREAWLTAGEAEGDGPLTLVSGDGSGAVVHGSALCVPVTDGRGSVLAVLELRNKLARAADDEAAAATDASERGRAAGRRSAAAGGAADAAGAADAVQALPAVVGFTAADAMMLETVLSIAAHTLALNDRRHRPPPPPPQPSAGAGANGGSSKQSYS